MEIEEFIEQDVLVYLDETLDKMRATTVQAAPLTPAVYITRDYEKELFRALDKSHVGEAKKVLHALKKEFDECPSGTPDKEKLKTLLITLYDKFKEHIDAQDTFGKFETGLEERPTTLAPKVETTPVRATADVKPSVSPKESFPELRALLSKAEQHLEQGELEHAALAYKVAKQEAQGAKDLPQELVLRYRSTFDRIKRAVEERKAQVSAAHAIEKQAAEAPLTAAKQPAVKPDASAPLPKLEPLPKLTAKQMDRQTLLQLEQEKSKLDSLLKRSDLPGAAAQHQRMRLLAQQINDPRILESTRKKLQRIAEVLEKMRGHAVYDERKLMAVP